MVCSRVLSITVCLPELPPIFGGGLIVLLLIIPDELGGIRVANGFADVVQLEIGGLQQLLRLFQFIGPNNGSEGLAG